MSTPLNVLIVEDVEADAFLLLRELRRGDYEPNFTVVDTAADMREALDRQRWDIVICDYSMPSFNALDALKLVQSFGLDIPFIIVSGEIGEDVAVAAMKAGAHDYLIKGKLARLIPVINRELREADTRLAKRQAEMSLRHAYDELEILVQQRTAELEKVSQQNQLILNSVAEGIFGTDRQGIITFVNPAAMHLTSYAEVELIGSSLPDHLAHVDLNGELLSASESPIFDTLSNGKFQYVTNGLLKRADNSSFAVEYTSVPIQEEEQVVGAVITFRDITERQAIERMKDEFISVVSHELRTPLSSIRGAISLLMTQQLGMLSEKGQRMLEIAMSNTDRLVRLINDILDLERIESGRVVMQKQACSPIDLIYQAIDCTSAIADKSHINLIVSPNAVVKPWQVWADSDRIVQVLTNLISNAVKFAPVGTDVHITWEPMGNLIKFGVSDHGRGIPSDKLESIFGRFQQVDASDSRKKGGTGLGLAICRSIIQQHDCEIWAESELGYGSSFYFTLPLLEPEVGSLSIDPQQSIILIYDENATTDTANQNPLQQQGYQTIVAASPTELLNEAISLKPAAILIDLTVSSSVAYTLMSDLKSHSETKDIPIVMVSALCQEHRQGYHQANLQVGSGQPYLTYDSLVNALQASVLRNFHERIILLIEDNPDLAQVFITAFEPYQDQAKIIHTKTGWEAIQMCQSITPDLLVLDLELMDCEGFAVVEWCRQKQNLCHIPLIVYTVRELNAAEQERLTLGQTQFFTKSRNTLAELESSIVGLLNSVIPK